MTSFVLTNGAYSEQTLADGEIGIVGANAVIVADSATGIDVNGATGGGYVTINVFGQILSTNREAIDVAASNLRLLVGADAALTSATLNGVAYSAVVLSGGNGLNEIDNLGLIQSQSFGMYLEGNPITSSFEVYNAGTVLGSTAITLATGNFLSLVNSGRIVGDSTGINASANSAARIANTGEIRGVVSVATASGSDAVFNRGALWGDVSLGAGNDVMDNRRGHIEGDVKTGTGNDSVDNRGGSIFGDVLLGDGNDVIDNRDGAISGMVLGEWGDDLLMANAVEADHFDGSDGVDVVDFRHGAAVVVALDGTFENARAALNDEFINVERVYGSRTGADLIRGNGVANLLRGEGGADTLDGAAGFDLLNGGRGVDLLTGGAGNDTFQFASLDHVGDVVSDFISSGAEDDRFQISAAGFGGGLAAGALAASQFQSRADNVAQDGNDRFIFRTTDRTLWFDADGTGAGLALMVADLQAGAVVVAADIVLY